MKTLFLLVTLTQNGAGDINASFVNTETLQQCQQKATMVAAVFSAAKIPVIEGRCIKGQLQFSEFGHAAVSSNIRHFYRVHVTADDIAISTMPDWQSCKQQEKIKLAQGAVYCSSSVQSLVPQSIE